MVARGDLGVELPAEDVPILQKRLINTANQLGIPIITATQMLDSMASNPRPTRAEVSDVANAILDGTDAVMLSNETAVGHYPIEAVATMARIAERIEREQINSAARSNNKQSIPNAISSAVSQIAEQLGAAAIITLTKTGSTARNVSRFRPKTPILAVTPHREVAQQLQLVWGVKPMLLLDLPSTSQTFQVAMNLAQENNLLADGDLVVMTAGTLQGGVHTLIEKPIAASISEAESLVNAAADHDCILQVGHIERFNPAFQELSKVLKTEEILAIESHRMSPYSQRANDVSVVLDLMIHDIDLILELVSAPVVKLTASGSRAATDSGYLDYVTATLGFSNGVVANLTASKVTHRKIRRLAAHCKNSLTEADFLNNEILIHRQTTANYSR